MADFKDLGLDFEEEGISTLSRDPVTKPPGDSGGASTSCCAGCVGCIGDISCTNDN